MTKKHFEKIAQILGQAKREKEFSQMVNRLMNFFEEENPNFDRSVFLRAVNKYSYSSEIPKEMREKLTIPAE